MSAKDCGNHGHSKKKMIRKIIWAIIVFLFIVLATILLIWAILQPTKPRFVLQDATVFAFNITAPNFLTSNFQVTISSRNPNDKIGIYYDRLDIYATYRNQQITLRTALPPGYQGHKEIDVWSPFVYGNSVPIAPYNSMSLSQDQNAGLIYVMIKIDGRVRWKVGAFISGRYHLYVKCPAYINFGNKPPTSGVSIGVNAVKYQLLQPCTVSV
ncbi:NDR1/HIN1-like protein 1 [Carica papaya]|uniref:NDR1/HIN1-like protein 1 n=1 Tax=Carica papaya TaxID=3649 RepID=UPI000B8CE0C7|nr:NDR1/HIN1-like protein 1 [Carica papaya]